VTNPVGTVVQDLGPLDWRIGIVDKSGRPTPEFQRRWNTQRQNNGLIGSVTLGSGPPTTALADGAEYIDITATPPALYVGSNGTNLKIGVFSFIQLDDVPSSYTTEAGNIVRVDPGETGLEFSTLTAILDSLGTTQGSIIYRNATGWVVLTPGTAGQLLSTGGAGADPSWVAPPTPPSAGMLPLVSGAIPAGLIQTPDGQLIGVPL
jgi:hypothetical protein